jgi:HAD superfamily hydrolase (TIGR01509 family)
MSDAQRVEAVLFDIDGTLIDSNGAHAQSWTQALGEHGIAVDVEYIRRLVGMGGDKLLPLVARVSEESEAGRAIAKRKKDIFGSLLPGLEPTPGARQLVAYLREQHVDVVIATSADDRETNQLLERAGVDDLIPQRASKDDAERSKPDPDIVRAALARSHARPETSVMVGDTPYDIEAARRAGISAFALRCGGYWTDAALQAADGIFDDPAALLAHWRHADRLTASLRTSVR